MRVIIEWKENGKIHAKRVSISSLPEIAEKQVYTAYQTIPKHAKDIVIRWPRMMVG